MLTSGSGASTASARRQSITSRIARGADERQDVADRVPDRVEEPRDQLRVVRRRSRSARPRRRGRGSARRAPGRGGRSRRAPERLRGARLRIAKKWREPAGARLDRAEPDEPGAGPPAARCVLSWTIPRSIALLDQERRRDRRALPGQPGRDRARTSSSAAGARSRGDSASRRPFKPLFKRVKPRSADSRSVSRAVCDGRDQRHARLVLGWRRPPARRGRGHGGVGDARLRRGDHRRRRRVDPARFRGHQRRRGAATDRARARGPRTARRVSIDTVEGGRRAARARARRRARERRDRAAGRPRAGRRRCGRRRVPLPDAHAGRAAHDAGRPDLRRRRLRRGGVPRGAARVRRRSRRARGARLPRPGHRLRQDGRAELRARAPARRARRDRAAGADRLLAQELARRGSSATRTSKVGPTRPRRSAPRSPRSTAARRSCACTTCASTSRRSRSRRRCAGDRSSCTGWRCSATTARTRRSSATGSSSSSTCSSRSASAAPTTGSSDALDYTHVAASDPRAERRARVQPARGARDLGRRRAVRAVRAEAAEGARAQAAGGARRSSTPRSSSQRP